MTNKNTKEIKQMKQDLAELHTKREVIDRERDKVSRKIDVLRTKYNAIAHSDMIGKCFKTKSWSDEEIHDRGGDKPYWMFTKILSLYRDDQCLCEEFHVEINKNTGDTRVITSFSYVHNDRSFICFFQKRSDGLERIPISEKEYNMALLKCIKECNLVKRGKK
jgi:hypothetical protein